MKTNPGTGWVRADALPSQSATEEILKLRRKIEDLQGKLEEQQSSAVKDQGLLVQGDDVFSIPFSFGAYKGSYRPEKTYTHKIETTWNSIFGNLSPHLIDEASDKALGGALISLVQNECLGDLVQNPALAGYEVKGFQINDGVLNTVKVQLLALGLIQKSTSKKARSVSDRSAYFTLTPRGEALMMSLRAIRRQPAPTAHGPTAQPEIAQEQEEEEQEEVLN
jgi:hypothetical protein